MLYAKRFTTASMKTVEALPEAPLYHVTDVKNREAIVRHGLKAKAGYWYLDIIADYWVCRIFWQQSCYPLRGWRRGARPPAAGGFRPSGFFVALILGPLVTEVLPQINAAT